MKSVQEPLPATEEGRLALAGRHAEAAWRQVGMRLRAVTPSGLAHLVLVIAAIVAILWVMAASWPAVLPFVIGAVIAYAVVPVVGALERFMPRVVAAFLTMAGVVLFVVLFLALVIPPIVRELYQIYRAIPSPDDIARYRAQLDQHISTLPGPTQDFINAEIETVSANLRANLDGYLSRPLGITTAAILRALRAASVFVGFLLIPTWLLAVLKDRRKVRHTIRRVVPAGMAEDFWAVVRICDRTLSAFVRGQLVLGLIVGALTWGGMAAMDIGHTGGIRYARYGAIMGMLAGILQLVPAIGPIVSIIIGVLIGLSISRKAAVLVLVVYLAVQIVVGRFIAPRFARRVADLHPAVLVACIVALSQFGILWTLVAAPLVAVARDLFRYTYGRLGDPPRPTGLLPGEEPAPERRAARTASGAAVPLVYRRGRASRLPRSGIAPDEVR
jgi:predicted PurR-regulated permease PerM